MKTSAPILTVFASALALFLSCNAAAAAEPSASSEPLLNVKGDKLVDSKGQTVRLRGFGLGGMLHMENFIDGYPGNEEAFREILLKAMGPKKYDLFFDAFYENYFTEGDAHYIASLGLNLVRIPINYRLFEDDTNPRVIKQDGFRYLDRVIRLCAAQGIYTIIDLHALPGYQNQHWHSDNPTHKALLWKHKDFQDRTVVLWEAIASHYRDEPWVAGYDLINEPADPTGERVVPFFHRLMDAIRKVDPVHILFVEGNTYARDFDGFDPTWKNVVYTNHDYAGPGFVSGGPYPGVTGERYYDRKTVEADFLEKSRFMIDNGLPIWVGEFGPVYTGDAQKDEMRYQLLKDQLAIYDKHGVSWCIWLYRDLGLQALVYQPESTAWMQRIKPMLDKKQRLGADAWGSLETGIHEVMDPIDAMLTREFPDYDPYPNGAKREARLLVRHILIAEALLSEFGKAFEGLSDDQVVELARSFNLDKAERRTRLEAILSGKER
jgi:aryl-phospho-beta-D-glucosidase BglC (GH1 family)